MPPSPPPDDAVSPGHVPVPAAAGPAGPAGRVVLVTGGSRGIGLACARRFQAAGDQVAVTFRGDPPAEVSGGAGTADLLALRADVTDAGAVDAAFTEVEERFGPVEVLVANAGITRDTLLLRMDEAAWQEVLDTNLTGAWRVLRRGLKGMVRAHRGRIVLVSSVVGFYGSPGQVNYAAAKAGMLGMARSLAREVGSRGITVNVVAPGVVETDMIASLGDQRVEQLRALVPLGRTTTPDEVAGVVSFLASPDAGYITGALVPVDGGLAMGL